MFQNNWALFSSCLGLFCASLGGFHIDVNIHPSKIRDSKTCTIHGPRRRKGRRNQSNRKCFGCQFEPKGQRGDGLEAGPDHQGPQIRARCRQGRAVATERTEGSGSHQNLHQCATSPIWKHGDLCRQVGSLDIQWE